MIYINDFGVFCAGINDKKDLKKLSNSKTFLEKSSDFSQEFIVGKCKNSQILPDNLDKIYKTRTNEILYTALLQIEESIFWAIKKYKKERIAVVMATTTSGINENYLSFTNYAKNGIFKDYLKDRTSLFNPANFIAKLYDLKNLSFCVSTACTSSLKAMMSAAILLENGVCDCVICGGVDSLNDVTLRGFASLEIISSDFTNPFSKNRQGINIGEGAGVFLLSKKESDFKISGFASNNDAFHITKPDLSGKNQKICVENALKMANLQDADYINLHGTGTIANDKMESEIFSNFSAFSSSSKPFFGHTLGAAGAIESAVCLHCLKDENLPLHLWDGDFDSDLKPLKLVKFGDKKICKTALNSSFAFGGDNAIMIFEKV